MRIVYITNTISGAGGLERVLLLKAAYLAERLKYDVTIITTSYNREENLFYHVSPFIKRISINPDKANKFVYFKSYAKLLNESIEAVNPDVVIICDNGLKSFLLPFILKRKRVLVYERHITKFIKGKAAAPNVLKRVLDKLNYSFMNYSAARFTKFVVVTQHGKNEWDLNNVTVIPNPLWFKTENVSNLKNKKVIAVGRHSYEKGYDQMFTIWKKVLERYPDWSLDIYGDYNPDYNIKQMAIDCGLTSGVNFLPPTTDILEVYRNTSLYIMTSRFEGFGMVLLEAMGCGVPCIAYDCPVGPAEIISNGLNGFLIEDGNTDAFLNSIISLIENNELRFKMGAKAAKSSETYNIDAIMQQWDTFFKSLL